MRSAQNGALVSACCGPWRGAYTEKRFKGTALVAIFAEAMRSDTAVRDVTNGVRCGAKIKPTPEDLSLPLRKKI